MVKKVYRVENLDCANCAAKVEAALNALPEVQEAVLTYATMQLRITAEDPDALLPKLQEAAQKVEPEVEFYPRDGAHTHHSHTGEHEHHHDCCCGHEHHHDHDHEHEHCHDHAHDHHHDDDHEHEHEHHHNHEHTHEHSHNHGHEHGGEESEDLKPILVGAVLFVVGLVLDHFGLKWPTLGVCLVAYVLLGREVIVTAVKNLARGQMLDENFLMALASIGAFFTGSFTEAVGVMLFYRVGEYFEDRAVARSRSQIMEAVDLRPEVVQLVDGETVREIPAGEAKIGDVVLVRPGDRIPLGGIVVSGSSRIDTAPITGEPVPVSVAEGDSVVSGCVNTTGQLTVRVEKPLSESMVTRILDSVENAAASKPKIDRFITRFARVYTPIVVGAAVLTAIIPSLITGDWGKWVYTALTFLVMSCPCALVLSVPLAFFAGIGAGSKRGILFKGGQSMEAMSKIKAVIMDKTGTITKGDFTVQKIVGGDELLELCADCEQQSTHPIAESIVAAAKARNMELRRPEELEELAGRGIRAKLDGKEILCGNERLLTEQGVSFPKSREYGTKVLVAVDGVYQGYLLIADTIKTGAENAVRALRDSGIETVMLTGDAEPVAKAVSAQLGLDEYHAGLLPGDKVDQIETLIAAKKSKENLAFVGDGINDAPVLSRADVGIAMGALGSDAAIEAADVVLMDDDPAKIALAMRIARRTLRIVYENIVFALAVKFACLLLGAIGMASMWTAIFADVGVMIIAVLNATRALYTKDLVKKSHP